MTLLGARYELLGIEDVEAFTARLVHKSGLALSHRDFEELHVFLIETCWELSERYQPGGRITFATWAGQTLRLRVVDWQRKRFGRRRWQWSDHSYERERPSLVPLDDGLVDALPARTGDPADSGDPDLAGLLEAGDRQRARDLELLGLDPPQRST